MNLVFPRRRWSHDQPTVLTFAPLAWLKLQFFCHHGNTEIGGFGISSQNDPLYIEDFCTVRQEVTPMTVRFADVAVADFFDSCVDRGLTPARFGRVWLHTHPGASVTPSGTDEDTFERVFGGCDWALMFILGRTAQTYARLSFFAGPGGQFLLPVQVDWATWPKVAGPHGSLGAHLDLWEQEYAAHIEQVPEPRLQPAAILAPHLYSEYAEFHDPWFEDFADELFFNSRGEPGPAPAWDRAPGAAG